MNKAKSDIRDRILIIGETEKQTRKLANVLGSDYAISAAPGVLDAAGRMQKETFKLIIYDLHDSGSDLENIMQTLQQLAPPDTHHCRRPVAGCSTDRQNHKSRSHRLSYPAPC